jgi:hypothetical protein
LRDHLGLKPQASSSSPLKRTEEFALLAFQPVCPAGSLRL